MGEHRGDRGPDQQPRKGSNRHGTSGPVRGTGGPRTARQRDQALALLARPGRLGSCAEVGKAMGVDPRSVQRWLKDPGFSADLAEIQAAATADAHRLLANTATSAVLQMTKLSKKAAKEDMAKVKATEVLLGACGLTRRDPAVEVNVGGGAFDELLRLPDAELERKVLEAAAKIERRRALADG